MDTLFSTFLQNTCSEMIVFAVSTMKYIYIHVNLTSIIHFVHGILFFSYFFLEHWNTGEYNDGCEEKVKMYQKEQIQKTKKRIGGKKIWKKMIWSERYVLQIFCF